MVKNSACKALCRQVSPSRRLTEWRLMLSDLVFNVRDRPGKDSLVANAMSRLETGAPTHRLEIWTSQSY